MSERSPYEQLGVTQDASFEEIQAARHRLTQQYSGDRNRVQEIETAYDAVLMDRLRLRQEGKIKVPEGIRFAERELPKTPPSFPAAPPQPAPAWLQRTMDTPSTRDILIPAGIFGALSLASIYSPSTALAVGAMASLYLLYRKENRFGRALLIAFLSLVVGVLLGTAVASLLEPSLSVPAVAIAAWVAFFILWLTTSFLR